MFTSPYPWEGEFTFRDFVMFCGTVPETVTYRYVFPEHDAIAAFAHVCGIDRPARTEVLRDISDEEVKTLSELELMEYCQMWAPSTFRACYLRGLKILAYKGVM